MPQFVKLVSTWTSQIKNEQLGYNMQLRNLKRKVSKEEEQSPRWVQSFVRKRKALPLTIADYKDDGGKTKCLELVDKHGSKKWIWASYDYKFRDTSRIIVRPFVNELKINQVYTWILSPTRGLIVGEIKDGFEFGVGHEMLAYPENEQIIIAGELMITPSEMDESMKDLIYNFQSGTYSSELDLSDNPRLFLKLKQLMEIIFRWKKPHTTPFARISHTFDILIPSTYPSLKELSYICSHKSARNAFRTTKPYCPDEGRTGTSVCELVDDDLLYI